MGDLGYTNLTPEEMKELEHAKAVARVKQDIDVVLSLVERTTWSPLLDTRINLLNKLHEELKELINNEQ